ncbi:MAG: hypothetical protein AAFX78_10090 [Cyanobacteria bacterium J06638_20]
MPLSDRKEFPAVSCIYFALSDGTVQYIGRAKDLRQRWAKTHEKQKALEAMSTPYVAYVTCPEAFLDPAERALIERFNPPLNGKFRKKVTLSELRSSLLDFRRRVQRGERFRIEYYSHPVAWLISVEDAEQLDVPTEREKEIGIVDFRSDMTQVWESLDSGDVDIWWLLYHGKRRMAVVREALWREQDQA